MSQKANEPGTGGRISHQAKEPGVNKPGGEKAKGWMSQGRNGKGAKKPDTSGTGSFCRPHSVCQTSTRHRWEPMEGWRLVTVGSHTQTYKQSYSIRTVKDCNVLLQSMVSAGTLALFKSQLASHTAQWLYDSLVWCTVWGHSD